MDKEETYSFRLDPNLKKAFNETAKRNDIPGSRLLREWMRQYIDANKQQELKLGGQSGRKNR